MVIIVLVVLLLGGGVAAVVVLNVTGSSDKVKEATIDEIVEYAYETTEITTDLEDGSFVRIQFKIITDGKKAREEIEKREFQIKNILIKELATMTEEDFKAGLSQLEDTMKVKINEVMTNGKVTDVYTINKILQ